MIDTSTLNEKDDPEDSFLSELFIRKASLSSGPHGLTVGRNCTLKEQRQSQVLHGPATYLGSRVLLPQCNANGFISSKYSRHWRNVEGGMQVRARICSHILLVQMSASCHSQPSSKTTRTKPPRPLQICLLLPNSHMVKQSSQVGLIHGRHVLRT